MFGYQRIDAQPIQEEFDLPLDGIDLDESSIKKWNFDNRFFSLISYEEQSVIVTPSRLVISKKALPVYILFRFLQGLCIGVFLGLGLGAGTSTAILSPILLGVFFGLGLGLITYRKSPRQYSTVSLGNITSMYFTNQNILTEDLILTSLLMGCMFGALVNPHNVLQKPQYFWVFTMSFSLLFFMLAVIIKAMSCKYGVFVIGISGNLNETCFSIALDNEDSATIRKFIFDLQQLSSSASAMETGKHTAIPQKK